MVHHVHSRFHFPHRHFVYVHATPAPRVRPPEPPQDGPIPANRSVVVLARSELNNQLATRIYWMFAASISATNDNPVVEMAILNPDAGNNRDEPQGRPSS